MIPNGCVLSFIILIFLGIYTSSYGISGSVGKKFAMISRRNSDMNRIQNQLEPFRSLFKLRHTYRKYSNELKTKWNCCRLQRKDLFDMRNMHQNMIGIADCYEFIKNNRNKLSKKCQNNLKFFDPTRGDISTCDGRLLHNLTNQYSFNVQFSNYTEKFCNYKVHPMIIYMNITRIIQCEQAIRLGLGNNLEDYLIYDNLSKNLLDIYVNNIENYRDCNDPEY